VVTAAARTNSIGHTVPGIDSGFGDMARTEQFKIHCADGKSDAFKDADVFNRTRKCLLGDLMSHEVDDVQTIAQSIFENGLILTEKVELFVYSQSNNKKNLWEVRAKGKRYMCLQHRVYSTKG